MHVGRFEHEILRNLSSDTMLSYHVTQKLKLLRSVTIMKTPTCVKLEEEKLSNKGKMKLLQRGKTFPWHNSILKNNRRIDKTN